MFKYLLGHLLLCSNLIWGQLNNPVSMSLSVESPGRAGEVIDVHVDALMDDQWKIYSIYKIAEGPIPTEISISGVAIAMAGIIAEPEPDEDFDPGFDVMSYYHNGNTRFTIPVKLKRNLEPGNYDLAVSMFYQVCNERLCYPPRTITDTVIVLVEEGDPRPDRAFISSSIDDLSNDKKIPIFNIILLAIGGAILSWIMPCVYPMIPIIISFFGKTSEDKNIGRSAVALLYGAGIAGTFIFIGLLVSFLSWGVNDAAMQSGYANIGNFIATNAWLNLALGLVFIFFALWMFGLVNVNVTGALLTKTDSAGQSAKNAYIGSIILGVAFAITSFSCTVPVVGTLLVIAASGTASGLFTSLIGMIVYGLVFAFPFVILSLFPSSLDKLPRSGIWMEKLKVVFGFIELAAAVKFLWVPDLEWKIGLMPRGVVLALFLVIGIGLILYLLGLYSFQPSSPGDKPKASYIGVIITLIVLLPIGLSIKSAPTYHYTGFPRIVDELIEAMVPPPPTDDEIAVREGWFVDDYDGALEKAKREGKALFIDFTGVYCANCRVMERRIFPLDNVKKQFDKMVLARLYVDKKDSLSLLFAQMQFERYKTATQPYYVILDPENEETLVDTGGYIPSGFENFLLSGVKKFNSQK